MLRVVIVLLVCVLKILPSGDLKSHEQLSLRSLVNGLHKLIMYHQQVYGATGTSAKYFVQRLYTPGALYWGEPRALIGNTGNEKYSSQMIDKKALEGLVYQKMRELPVKSNNYYLLDWKKEAE